MFISITIVFLAAVNSSDGSFFIVFFFLSSPFNELLLLQVENVRYSKVSLLAYKFASFKSPFLDSSEGILSHINQFLSFTGSIAC